MVGDLHKGSIIEEFDRKIVQECPLSDYIKELTGLTDNDLNQGTDLKTAVYELEALIKRTKTCRSPVVWGNGDLRALKAQSGAQELGHTHREIDLKTIHQFFNLANSGSMRGGLSASMEKWGLTFQGRPHDALRDARNTFYLACQMAKRLKGLNV